MVAKVLQLSLIATLSVATVTALPIRRSAIVCHPTTWHDIAVFFVVNYIAHAATIPTAPGAKWYDTAAWTILSLLQPFAGLGKSLGLITRYFCTGGNGLEKAWIHDALMVVVRSDDWEPAGAPEEVYVKLPRGFHWHELDEDPATLPSATIFCNEQHDFTGVATERIQVHGRVLLPKGYCLAFPDGAGLLSEYFPFNSPANKHALLARSQSWLKMAISIAQLCYSSATVYQTRGGQLETYGYAAFGLSVFPYAFMSLANLICVGLVGEYPSVYLVHTRIMDEAEKRGGSFNGVVGSCREEHQGDGEDESTPDHRWGEFTRVRLSMEVKGGVKESKEGDKISSQEHFGPLKEDGDHLQKILVVTVGDVTRRFFYHPRGEIDSAAFEFEVSSVANQDRIPHGGYVFKDREPSLSTLLIFLVISLVILASFILPYIVIFMFSGFEVGRSTVAQRAWMMSWASSGQLSLVSFGLVTWVYPHFSLLTRKEATKSLTFIRGRIPSLILPSLILLPIPAIGGFITVGKMLKDFGTCSLAPA
ncbi:hypothetical protein JAAARDRAFT_198625 [Jaapia argillacea MUCL 33604]|uniref:Uncharacterized protein n=1 Tax=Jaapia argillacea MUCL 33604 TaxID=933084 RepID=A0A067PDT4_9AGAM|nr:hypothetical protein JAAARDRAFT_198625 [Jaapia argillacea MUCL 33604]